MIVGNMMEISMNSFEWFSVSSINWNLDSMMQHLNFFKSILTFNMVSIIDSYQSDKSVWLLMMFLFIHLNLFISILSRNIPLPKPGNRPTLAIRRSSWCAAFGSPRAIPCCTSRTETLKFGDLRSKTPTGWWFGTFFIFPYDLGKSSSQLTESYFSEELKPPTSRMVQA